MRVFAHILTAFMAVLVLAHPVMACCLTGDAAAVQAAPSCHDVPPAPLSDHDDCPDCADEPVIEQATTSLQTVKSETTGHAVIAPPSVLALVRVTPPATGPPPRSPASRTGHPASSQRLLI